MTQRDGRQDRKGQTREIERAARQGLAGAIASGVAGWDRSRLARLIPVGPEEIADTSRAGRLRVLRRLLAALRGERMRGRAGHWSYSLDRHLGLVQAVAAERRALGLGHSLGPASDRAGP